MPLYYISVFWNLSTLYIFNFVMYVEMKPTNLYFEISNTFYMTFRKKIAFEKKNSLPNDNITLKLAKSSFNY